MAYRSTQEARHALFSIASSQGGYFTAKQGAEAGYDYPHLAYHVRSGNFARIGQGLYRLPEVPLAEQDELIRLTLWSRGRDDQPQAVVSHASALALHGLSDVIPAKVHLTVPPTFRKRAPVSCVLHRSRLAAEGVEEREGFRITTALRTLLDVGSTGGGVTAEQLRAAVAEALERGLVRRAKLAAAASTEPSAGRLASLVEQIS